ncbi:MAG: ABC transporter substrate-binding protein [Deinococcota bacterium]
MMLRRLIKLLAVMLLALAPLSAFAQDYEGVDPNGQEITFWHNHTGVREDLLNELVDEFNASNEYGITVNASNQGGYGDIFQKMLPLLNTDAAPDLVVAYQNQAATYQLADALIDVAPLVESPTWGLSDTDLDDFFAGFLSQDVFPTFDSKRLGFPPNRSMEVMYYNQEWLAELGYDTPPSTPAEFQEMACAAANTPFSSATGAGSSVGYRFTTGASTVAAWVYAFGGDIYDADTNQYTYNSPAAIEAFNFLQDLIEEGCLGLVAERFGDQTDFGAGTSLFTTGSTSGFPFYQGAIDEGAQFEWSVAPIPHNTAQPVQNIYGASVSLPKHSPESELATWLFIKYFTSAETQARWAGASGYFPVRQSVAEGMETYFEENPAYATAFDLLATSTSEPPVPGYDFVRDAISQAAARIMEGADVTETLNEVNEEANEILADQLAQLE